MAFSELLNLLSKKKNLFLQFEEISEKMFLNTIDQLEQDMEKREEILQTVSAIDQSIAGLCENHPRWERVLKHELSPTTLQPDEMTLYDTSLSIKAIVNRILSNAPALEEHLASEKQRIADKMSELDYRTKTMVDGYHQSVLTGLPTLDTTRTNKII